MSKFEYCLRPGEILEVTGFSPNDHIRVITGRTKKVTEEITGRDEHIARLKRELERDIALLDNRDAANLVLKRDVEMLKGELARRFATHEVREKLEEMLRRERLLSEERLHSMKVRDDRILYLTNQVNDNRILHDRIVGLLTED